MSHPDAIAALLCLELGRLAAEPSQPTAVTDAVTRTHLPVRVHATLRVGPVARELQRDSMLRRFLT